MKRKIYNQPATQIAHIVLNTVILAGSPTPSDSIVPGGGGNPIEAI